MDEQEYNPWTGTYTTASGNQYSTGLGVTENIGGLGGSIADLIGSKGRIETYGDEYNKAKDAIENWYKDAQGKFDIKISPELESAYKLAETRKTNVDPILASQAEMRNTLSNDPRLLLAGLNRTSDPSAILAARESDFQNTVAARKGYGQELQRIDEANISRQYELALRQLGYSEEAARTAAENKAQEEAARREAIGNLTGSAIKIGTSFLLEDGGRVPMYNMGGSVLDQIMGGGMAGGQPQVQGPFPGEASHETNPIHMVNNDGQKVGEAMGGEYMINKEQGGAIMEGMDSIEDILEEGREPSQEEWRAFYESVNSVFAQPQFRGEEEMMS